MKAKSISDRSTRIARWFAPCVAVVGMVGCGGVESPPGRTDAATVIQAVDVPAAVPVEAPVQAPSEATTLAPTEAPTDAPSVASASAGASTAIASTITGTPPAQIVVASVLPRPRSPSADPSQRAAAAHTPARWLDAELPQGTLDRPVMVVVPGALPQEAESLALERGKAARIAR